MVGQQQPKLPKQQKLPFHFWIYLRVGSLGTFRCLLIVLADLLSMIVHCAPSGHALGLILIIPAASSLFH
jgi:hypothetical protein